MKKRLAISAKLMLLCVVVAAQSGQGPVLTFNEFLGYVKAYHPVARQAELTLSSGQANLMKARGGFDPRIVVDYERKEFKGTEYYDRLNATFKIPTWYGIELKGNFEQNEGEYINPDETVPADGLYSAGISVSLARGLWINERMSVLKQARLFREQARAERDLQVNEILFQASVAYFNWLQAYNEQQIFESFLKNAETRFQGIRKSALAGDIPIIDTVEAKIAVQDRALSLEQAKVQLNYKTLELSTFLWLEDNVPVELQPDVVPDTSPVADIDRTLEISGKPLDSFPLEKHPKLLALGYKIDALEVEKNLKFNQLLPQIDLEYNFLTETPELINTYKEQQYKGGISFYFPLFLRKERGDLKLARIKLQDARLDLDNTGLILRNKILGIYSELESFQTQTLMARTMVDNYRTMLAAEERKFSFGESSLFLINTRESKLIDSELKQNNLQNKFYIAKAKLFNSLATNPAGL